MALDCRGFHAKERMGNQGRCGGRVVKGTGEQEHDLLREFAISEAQKHHLSQIDGNILQKQQLEASTSTSTSAATTLTHVRRLGIDGGLFVAS
ncbi:hypothetical protein ACLOJK_035885 [Asimina triloba]